MPRTMANRIRLSNNICECCLASGPKVFDMKKYSFEIVAQSKPITYFECYAQYIPKAATEPGLRFRPKICPQCASQLETAFKFLQQCEESQKILETERNKKKRRRQPLSQTSSSSNWSTSAATIESTSTIYTDCCITPPQHAGGVENMDVESPSYSPLSHLVVEESSDSSVELLDPNAPRPTEEVEIEETDEEELERRLAALTPKPKRNRHAGRRRRQGVDGTQPQLLFSSDEDNMGIFDEFLTWY